MHIAKYAFYGFNDIVSGGIDEDEDEDDGGAVAQTQIHGGQGRGFILCRSCLQRHHHRKKCAAKPNGGPMRATPLSGNRNSRGSIPAEVSDQDEEDESGGREKEKRTVPLGKRPDDEKDKSSDEEDESSERRRGQKELSEGSWETFKSLVVKEKISDRDAWRHWAKSNKTVIADRGWPVEGIQHYWKDTGFPFTTFKTLVDEDKNCAVRDSELSSGRSLDEGDEANIVQADEETTIKSDDLFVRFKAFLKAENITYRDQWREMKKAVHRQFNESAFKNSDGVRPQWTELLDSSSLKELWEKIDARASRGGGAGGRAREAGARQAGARQAGFRADQRQAGVTADGNTKQRGKLSKKKCSQHDGEKQSTCKECWKLQRFHLTTGLCIPHGRQLSLCSECDTQAGAQEREDEGEGGGEEGLKDGLVVDGYSNALLSLVLL